jgi:hypothetical protein
MQGIFRFDAPVLAPPSLNSYADLWGSPIVSSSHFKLFISPLFVQINRRWHTIERSIRFGSQYAKRQYPTLAFFDSVARMIVCTRPL